MALNKYMHRRNIYRVPPDFTELCKKYGEFAEIAKLELNNCIKIDFKDLKSLRVLTKCLLHKDFGLNVYIPEDKLVPTLPLRLNYILWLEDLLESIKSVEPITGIDIGTGACAIYPLLGAKKNKWKFIGTDIDDTSIEVAKENVFNNNLQDLITIQKNNTSFILKHCFDENPELTVDFSMCNPPFYGSVQELCESRNNSRASPTNSFSGSPEELITKGGEMEFVKNMILESQLLQTKIKIYTTMIGHKYVLKEIVALLKTKMIPHTHTDFCQGKTTRWGIAWSYIDLDLCTLVPPREEKRKKTVPMAYILPPLTNITYDTLNIFEKLQGILEYLEIVSKLIIKKTQMISLEIQANKNTWSNQRKKRRQAHKDLLDVKRTKTESINTESHEASSDNKLKISSNGTIAIPCDEKLHLPKDPESSQFPSTSNNSSTSGLILHALLTIAKRDNDIIMQMEYLEGSGGKDAMHQIIQYIKNNWK